MAKDIYALKKYICDVEEFTEQLQLENNQEFQKAIWDYNGEWGKHSPITKIPDQKKEDKLINLLWIMFPIEGGFEEEIRQALKDLDSVDIIILVDYKSKETEEFIRKIPLLDNYEIDTVRNIGDTVCTLTWFRREL